MRRYRFPLVLVLAALPCAALAQTTPSTPGTGNASGTGNAPVTGDQPTLSEKLNKTDGVIAPPPSGDADMTQKPPNVGTMPVIPPAAVTPPGQPPGTPRPEAK